MSRTAIVTSHPEVACEICARRLLRGEQPDTFLADGRTHLVCALCTDRARQAGWVRGAELTGELARPRARHRRSRSWRELLWRWSSREEHEPAPHAATRSRRREGAHAESSQG
jgi:hypothetical protein